ncbi:TetR/AcrR family transcriptional regulator C-terminal domain-containing protein [Kitasatospora sp. NPDC088346]|uniref:TetR/AcrR family transcriptional regulator C-terminal domain-containing protein n=1 Tax=Kitasatospora sp. NPDC088346 TaxID=3364073 RepID=UPI00382FD808
MRLHREDVLAGALGLLDQDGLDGLTMRRLATSLGVGPSALYWHYRDKQALLEAIAEEIMSGVADVDPALPPRERTAELARRLRRALLTRRDGARVLSGTYVRRPNTLGFGEAAVHALAAAGVPETETALAFFTIQDYVLGHVIEEQSREHQLATTDRTPTPDTAATGDYPAIGTAIRHWAARTPDDRFEYGLRLLLDGLDRRTGT